MYEKEVVTKVIFLDIDGPMAPGRSYFMHDHLGNNIFGGRCLDPVAVGMINQLCVKAKAKIVISSVWKTNGIKLFNALGKAGFDSDHVHEDWRTADYNGVETRSFKIKRWLDNHPEVDTYVCIDDEQLEGLNQAKVDFDEGFLLTHYKKCAKILNTGESDLIVL